jgi:hypothetical protein
MERVDGSHSKLTFHYIVNHIGMIGFKPRMYLHPNTTCFFPACFVLVTGKVFSSLLKTEGKVFTNSVSRTFGQSTKVRVIQNCHNKNGRFRFFVVEKWCLFGENEYRKSIRSQN